MKSRDGWKWYGFAGHFIGGRKCGYHLCTRVGDFLISTVGDYRPDGLARERLGASDDSFFETFVFRCAGENKGGDPNILDYSEIDGKRYAESIDAERGHYKFCNKYAKKLARAAA